MKIHVLTQQTAFVRVWNWKRFRFVWYRVQRAGEDWRPLEIGKQYVKPKSITQIAKDLNKKYPGRAPLPAILDEDLADREVEKNTPKGKGRAKKQKRQVS